LQPVCHSEVKDNMCLLSWCSSLHVEIFTFTDEISALRSAIIPPCPLSLQGACGRGGLLLRFPVHINDSSVVNGELSGSGNLSVDVTPLPLVTNPTRTSPGMGKQHWRMVKDMVNPFIVMPSALSGLAALCTTSSCSFQGGVCSPPDGRYLPYPTDTKVIEGLEAEGFAIAASHLF